MRRLLRKCKIRFRAQEKKLPGNPDFVLPETKVALFVHGCFWHVHKCKPNRKLPATNTDYWENKLSKNIARDKEIKKVLRKVGWRTLTVWECQLDSMTEKRLLSKVAKK